MTLDEKKKADIARYERAAHAMQSAVAAQVEVLGAHGAGATPKHLRTGVNSALADSNALATLLIAKGVFTEGEYLTAVADAMEREAERMAKDTREKLGLPEDAEFV